jgi:hypothetical protein
VVLYPADPARPGWTDVFEITGNSSSAIAEVIAAQVTELGVFETPSNETP